MSRKKIKKTKSKSSSPELEPAPPRDKIHDIADNLIFSGALLVLFLRPFLSGRTYPAYNHFFNIAMAVLGVLWLVKAWRKGALELHNRLVTVFVLGFLLVCSFTFFTTVNNGLTLRYIYELMAYTVLFLVVANNFREHSSIKAAVVAFMAAGILVNVYGIFQRFVTLPMTREYVEEAIKSRNTESFLGVPMGFGVLNRLESTRIFSTFLFPNAYALYLCILGAIIVGFLWSAYPSVFEFAGKSFSRLCGRMTEGNALPAGKRAVMMQCLKGLGGILLLALLVVSCVLTPWCLWLTYSRGGLLGAAFVVFAFVLVKIAGKKEIKQAVAVAVAAVVLVSILQSTSAFSADTIDVKETSFLMRLKDSLTVKQRFFYWKTTMAMISDNPWFGIGWGAFESAYPRYMVLGGYPVKLAHNNYLQVWAETGIVGLNLFAGMWLVTLLTFWRKVRSPQTGLLRGIACGLGAGIIAFLANSLVDFALYLPSVMVLVFLCLGLLVAIPSDDEKDKFTIPFKLPAALISIALMLGFIILLCRSYIGLSLYNDAERERTIAFPNAFALERGFESDPGLQYAVLKRSVPTLTKSISYFPASSDAYFMLGDTYLKLAEIEKNPNHIADALANLKRAAERNPASPYIQQSIAVAYWMEGSITKQPESFQNALLAEQQAAENFPVNPAYRAKLAEIYAALGDLEKAEQEAAAAAELAKHYREF